MIIEVSKTRLVSGETLATVLPCLPAKGTPVIMCHGAEGAVNGATAWTGYPTRTKVPAACMSERRKVFSPELAGNMAWGNADAQARMDEVFSYVGSEKVILACQSMGGTTGLTWAANNPNKVAGIVLVIPVINLTDLATSSYAGDINAAYGGQYSPVTHAAYNPLARAQAGAFNGIPIQCWYGKTDTLCKAVDAEEFIRLSPDAIAKPMTGGHEESVVSNISAAEIAQFIRNL